MIKIGYHASHEQFPPSELLSLVQIAEQSGFDCAMSSDHFNPWSVRQGQSGFAWSWLGSALQATSLPIGIITVPCGWRYHPAITAQAGATLAEMYPGRLPWVALGSGEALNEVVFTNHWPEKSERRSRLVAGAQIIRSLWRGETVITQSPIATNGARLHTLPKRAPRLVAGALSPETAFRAGTWADGLLTVNQGREKTEAVVEAFRAGGGGSKPLFIQIHVSFADTDEQALTAAYDQWRTNVIEHDQLENLATPQAFDDAAACVTANQLENHVHVSSNCDVHAARIKPYIDMGFEEVYLHNVGRNQRAFIETFGSQVIPTIRSWAAAKTKAV